MYVNALEQEYGGFLKKDPSVTLRFAKEYIDGRALKKDSLKAYELLSSGCLKENNAAIFYLAQCYELGWGVTQNMRMALSLYKKIARIDTRAGNKVFKIEREKTANN
jgi:TPR repeat protein